MIVLFCNPDFELRAAGLPAPVGNARAAAEAIGRLFALVGVPGSRLWLALGDHIDELDADALRALAASLGLYRPNIAERAPWSADMLVPYAWDARAARHAATSAATRVEGAVRANRKDASLTLALANDLEPGVFRHAAVVRSSGDLERALLAMPSVVDRWVLKPVLGFAGGGRIEGVGRSLSPRGLRRLNALLRRDGAVVLEPWVERTGDFSTQLYVRADGGNDVLFYTRLLNTPSGRYVGNASLATDAPCIPGMRIAAAVVGAWLASLGCPGPAGVDAFTYVDPLDGQEHLRPLVEVNARFTLGLLASFVASMSATPDTFHFRLDPAAPFGEWTATSWSSS